MQETLVPRLRMGQVLYSGDPFSTLTTQHNKNEAHREKHRFAMHVTIDTEKFLSNRAELRGFFFFLASPFPTTA